MIVTDLQHDFSLLLVNTPFFANLSDCRSFGIAKCENLQLDGGQGKLGAWYANLSSLKSKVLIFAKKK